MVDVDVLVVLVMALVMIINCGNYVADDGDVY